jgi:hypothetical protein
MTLQRENMTNTFRADATILTDQILHLQNLLSRMTCVVCTVLTSGDGKEITYSIARHKGVWTFFVEDSSARQPIEHAPMAHKIFFAENIATVYRAIDDAVELVQLRTQQASRFLHEFNTGILAFRLCVCGRHLTHEGPCQTAAERTILQAESAVEREHVLKKLGGDKTQRIDIKA